MAGASRNQLLARLHCLKKEQGWDDDTYRDILQARTGKRSAGDLEGPALARLVAALAPVSGKSASHGDSLRSLAGRRPHEWSWVDSAVASRRPLLRKLIMLMKGTTITRGHQVAYIEGIARQMGGFGAGSGPIEKPLSMCDEGELWLIVAALAKHVQRQGHDPNHV